MDTSAFYHEDERTIHNILNRNYRFKKMFLSEAEKNRQDKDRYKKLTKYAHNCTQRIKKFKGQLCDVLKGNTANRVLNEKAICNKNIISVFESTLTRTLKIQPNTVSTDLIIVQTYFFDIIRDIVINGFTYNGEKYVCFTASAGQIRTKKTVFIKESILREHHNTLTCGLSIEDINSCGGVNINKYLAYLALCNSATDKWDDFDITKSIVVEDMETSVEGEVDFIDDKTYTITRKKMQIPITHTDGCGMILPSKSKKNKMVRLPWVKGLLVVFPFDKFIREKSKESGTYCGVIKDIYGVEHDILKEKIEVIFTKSQFKMWKYFKSWEDYIEKYIKYDCQAGKCNEEEDKFSKAKLNYQMLQTLTDTSEEELIEICSKTKDSIRNIGRDKNTMLRVLGVVESNINKNYIQQALTVYPELLSDTYSKEILKQVKKSMVKDARAGKLEIEGVYTFISPDLYAFCEFLFLGDKDPKGLLEDKKVYCKLYKDVNKLDCLRSPHLYREHAIRENDIDKEKGRWFVTNALYTSCHDLISKVLQFDVDGDKSLVVAFEKFVSIAERNMNGIVPLYYNMAKAGAKIIDNKIIYEGLKTAYTGGNIGMISNDITKIWNSGRVNLDVIKILCMENNFTIDFAKTLYKPERPSEIKKLIRSYTKYKTPHFFIYAKDKEKDKVEKINDSLVNKLEKLIPNPKISFKAANLGKFKYKMLMRDTNVIVDELILEKYKELDLKKKFMLSRTEDSDKNNVQYTYESIKNELVSINSDPYYVADVLIECLYNQHKSNYKTTLWECFGDIIVENLKSNIKENSIMCEECGQRIDIDNIKKTSQRYCNKCKIEKEKEKKRKWWNSTRPSKKPCNL